MQLAKLCLAMDWESMAGASLSQTLPQLPQTLQRGVFGALAAAAPAACLLKQLPALMREPLARALLHECSTPTGERADGGSTLWQVGLVAGAANRAMLGAAMPFGRIVRGALCSQIAHLSSVAAVELTGHALSAPEYVQLVQSLAQHGTLTRLDLSGNSIGAHGCEAVHALAAVVPAWQRLQDLRLSGNAWPEGPATDLLLAHAVQLPALTCLELGDAAVSTPGSNALTALTAFARLDAHTSCVSAQVLGQLPHLRHLRLRATRIGGTCSQLRANFSACALEHCSGLTSLDLQGLFDVASLPVAALPELRHLAVRTFECDTSVADAGAEPSSDDAMLQPEAADPAATNGLRAIAHLSHLTLLALGDASLMADNARCLSWAEARALAATVAALPAIQVLRVVRPYSEAVSRVLGCSWAHAPSLRDLACFLSNREYFDDGHADVDAEMWGVVEGGAPQMCTLERLEVHCLAMDDHSRDLRNVDLGSLSALTSLSLRCNVEASTCATLAVAEAILHQTAFATSLRSLRFCGIDWSYFHHGFSELHDCISEAHVLTELVFEGCMLPDLDKQLGASTAGEPAWPGHFGSRDTLQRIALRGCKLSRKLVVLCVKACASSPQVREVDVSGNDALTLCDAVQCAKHFEDKQVWPAAERLVLLWNGDEEVEAACAAFNGRHFGKDRVIELKR